MGNILHRFRIGIQMDITVDVLLVSSCHIYGWNGKDYPDAANRLLAASIQLKHADIDKGLLVDLNDSGYTFDEIADYLDRVDK